MVPKYLDLRQQKPSTRSVKDRISVSPHLPNVEELLRTADGLRAELIERHQTLDVIIETNNAAKVFDADDVSVGHAAGTSIGITEEQW